MAEAQLTQGWLADICRIPNLLRMVTKDKLAEQGFKVIWWVSCLV